MVVMEHFTVCVFYHTHQKRRLFGQVRGHCALIHCVDEAEQRKNSCDSRGKRGT